MIIVLKSHSSLKEVKTVEKAVRDLGYDPHTIRGVVRTVVAAVGDETSHQSLEILESLNCVERVIPIQKRYKLVSREAQPGTTQIKVGPLTIGGGTFHVIAGPCSVESMEQMLAIAKAVKAAGATLLRGGVFKPRTSPYDFQGLGIEGLAILKAAKQAVGLPIVSEITRQTDLNSMLDVVDVLQIGARNAMNYSLLEAVAKSGKPVLLKRGMASTVEEWLLAAEYIAKNGNPNVILCERGIRTFENATRNTLDISAVALAKQECNLPVFVDPSHAAGRRDLIPALSKAAIATGADGLMIEVHNHPEEALSDSSQQLTPQKFAQLIKSLAPLLKASDMKIGKVK
ncbi:MAG: 3-deoxy-7-phosphoheptulonate synthase [Kiritimatiellae bacterium]|nr:3-deoxy-7-phosphoheptulonate synthase [Kiritimatiellia bacterium]MDD5520419.1 3-deoxy-7-phosphoheptulonate synthase [Kiritimatiellia bacterium]